MISTSPNNSAFSDKGAFKLKLKYALLSLRQKNLKTSQREFTKERDK